MSIWKTPDQKPDLYKILAIKTNKGNAYTNILTNEKEWNPILLPYFYDIGDIDKAERITLYAYLDDLIAQADKAERLQKQLDSLKKYSDSLRHRVEKMLKKNKILKNTASDYFMKSIELGIKLEKMKSNN